MARAQEEVALPVETGSFLYHLARALVRLLMVVFTRPSVTGIEHIPRVGGVLIVSNHCSVVDPPLLAAVCARPVAFMGKEELFRSWPGRFIFSAWGVFPVRRGETDVGAVRAALALLRAGKAVVLFPEGTRHPEALGEGHPGVSYLAARSGCPVVPVAITGTQAIRGLPSLGRRPAFRVRVGEPFLVGKEELRGSANPIMTRIAELLPPERRGPYGASLAGAAQGRGEALGGA